VVISLSLSLSLSVSLALQEEEEEDEEGVHELDDEVGCKFPPHQEQQESSESLEILYSEQRQQHRVENSMASVDEREESSWEAAAHAA
jgi:hypothetical protein